jgi:hypothetical protein
MYLRVHTSGWHDACSSLSHGRKPWFECKTQFSVHLQELKCLRKFNKASRSSN